MKKRRKRAENRFRFELSLGGVCLCAVDLPVHADATIITGYSLEVRGESLDFAHPHWGNTEANSKVAWELPNPLVVPRFEGGQEANAPVREVS